jgi:hypothetical protein
MAQTIVTLSGDDAELYKAFQRIIDQQAKTDGGYKKISKASKEAADAAKAAAKEAAEAEKNASKEAAEAAKAAARESAAAAKAAAKEQADAAREVANAVKASAKEQSDAELRRQQRIDTVIGSVIGLATAYISVSAAVQTVTKAHQVLVDNQDKALGKAKELAAAQQEAAKNLAGKTPQEISATLQKTVPEIARETQFSDLAKLTTALGSAASIVGEAQAKSVVTESARLTRFTPDQLQTTATATADIMAATGLGDAKQALALLASTGSVARPEELAKLAQGAAASVNAAIAQAPQQNKVDAAREGVALYAKLSKVDPQGQSAATATTDFIRQISTAFADPKVIKERTERIENLRLGATDNQLAVESAKLKIQDTERTAGFFKPDDQTPEANTARLRAEQAKQDLAQAELKARRDAKELDTLSVIQRVTTGQGEPDLKRQELTAQLQSLLAEAKSQALAADPKLSPTDYRFAPHNQTQFADLHFRGIETKTHDEIRAIEKELKALPAPQPKATTFAERLEVVRQTPELRASVSESLTGEAKFRPLFAELLNANSQISQELKAANSTITTDVKAFEQVAASTVETPQARVVAAANEFETARNIQQSGDTEGQVRAAVSAIFHEAMSSTSVDYVSATSSVAARATQYMTRSSEDSGSFGGAEIRQLQERIDYLQNVGAEPSKIETSAAAIEAINKLLILPERLELMRQEGENTNKFLAMQVEAMALTNRILQEGQNPPNPNNLRGMLMAPGANAGATP